MTGREFRNHFLFDVGLLLAAIAIGFWLRAT